MLPAVRMRGHRRHCPPAPTLTASRCAAPQQCKRTLRQYDAPHPHPLATPTTKEHPSRVAVRGRQQLWRRCGGGQLLLLPCKLHACRSGTLVPIPLSHGRRVRHVSSAVGCHCTRCCCYHARCQLRLKKQLRGDTLCCLLQVAGLYAGASGGITLRCRPAWRLGAAHGTSATAALGGHRRAGARGLRNEAC